jgi:hypothetical protein
VRLRWLRTSEPLIGKTCYQLGRKMFEPKGCLYISISLLWMQISRMVLVYDVKISQLGRKNLVIRFN